MDDNQLRSAQHVPVRKTLRIAGVVVLTVGGVLTLIGFGMLCALFASGWGVLMFDEVVCYFLCTLVGIFLLGVGGAMTMSGFLGGIFRYMAGESAPWPRMS